MRGYFKLSCSVLAVAGLAAPAFAQASRAGFDDIVVTARKRAETAIDVPVVLTAVSGADLERRGITSVDTLARVVPQLVVGEGGGTVQGGNISLRGISGSDANPFGDQAVSFNVDGVQVARASIRRMGEMDVEQVEVLKGPQALFFGKNSPGGIISVRTADPTDTLQAKLSGGYEFNAREWRGDGFIAGPISDTLGFRIAAYGTTMKGWVKSIVPEDSALQPNHRRAPDTDEWAVRGTLKWEPSERFDARLKFTYGERTGDSSTANVQFVNCPTGVPQTGGIDECKANDKVSVANIGPGFDIYDPEFGDGSTYLTQTQMLGGLEMNYYLTDTLTLTSVTGYYKVKLRNLANYTASYVPSTLLSSRNVMDIREISEELRLTSDFDGPVNFIFGGHYQDTHASNGSHTFLGTPGVAVPALGGLIGPIELNEYLLKQDGKAWSIFGQTTVDILPTLELSVGARYSYEKKKLPLLLADLTSPVAGDGALSRVTPPQDLTPEDNVVSFNNLSPEFTLSWRPTSNLNFFTSYKEGFLSGGWNSGAANFLTNLTYDQQLVKGFEGGVKAAMFDGALRTNLSLYTYRVSGLQVQVTTEGVVQELRNAGSVRTKGVEFDFNYRPPVEGLSLHGAIAYNHGRYTDYLASCYRGQTQPACQMRFNPLTGATGLSQDLSGTELTRAPEWTGNLGFVYEVPVGGNFKIGLSGDMTYSDSYLTDTSSREAGRSPSYTLFDAGLRFAQADDQWEVALIGRNLTDKYYWVRNSDNPFSGSNPGALPTPETLLGDVNAAISRGREVMLRLTYRFGG